MKVALPTIPQGPDGADIQVVRVAVTGAVVGELAVFDLHGHVAAGGGDAVLVPMEQAAAR